MKGKYERENERREIKTNASFFFCPQDREPINLSNPTINMYNQDKKNDLK